MVDPCESAMSEIAAELHEEFSGEATVRHDTSDPEDQYVYVAPTRMADRDAVLTRMERFAEGIGDRRPEWLFIQRHGDHLSVKAVEDPDDYTGNAWRWA